MDDETRELLRDAHRDVEDSAAEITDAIERLEAGDAAACEGLLGEALTRLKLVNQRIERRLDAG